MGEYLMNEFRMFAKDGLAVVVKDKGELEQ